MPKERHRANKKGHKHSPSKVFAHGVIKITILTTKDGPKLKRAPGLKQIVIIRTSWNRDIKPTELNPDAAVVVTIATRCPTLEVREADQQRIRRSGQFATSD
jgi:hypothetical protein